MIENADGRWEIVGITSFGKSWYVSILSNPPSTL